ncbi:hypothetical protein [uncultured Jatrophihabitans sp.]|uniref:hypothetical protein n=1 Tax=uncultured Jatrophihabitans sp. TaxID=1610747 RepID=UPI0035CC45E6
MEIAAALAADLRLLTEALDDARVDIADTLRRLGANAAAVASYLGLTVTVAVADDRFSLTSLDPAEPIRASMALPLPASGLGSARSTAVVILYAGTAGAFVDLAADLSWLTGRDLADMDLDGQLVAPREEAGRAVEPGGPDVGRSLRATSIVNQAVGVLIGRGRTPEQALAELDALATARGGDQVGAAAALLAALPN